jgi:hypothetical protein
LADFGFARFCIDPDGIDGSWWSKNCLACLKFETN